MGRIRRPDLPGVAFHLTQRLQNGAHLLTPRLRWQLLHLLRRHARRSDARILAYVFMTNHLHLVVVQGIQPLSRLMQPYLLAAALAIHAVHGTRGHAFERRYQDRICRDADHLRRAIAYTHANPVRAGMCSDPAGYPWSSHRAYEFARQQRYGPRLDLRYGLEVFAELGGRNNATAGYVRTLADMLRDNSRNPLWSGTPAGEPPHGLREPRVAVADRNLELIVLGETILQEIAPDLELREIVSRYGSRRCVHARRAVAMGASRAGFRNSEIARLLCVSESTISRMLRP
jgi:REP element-mobilizing transposase RayT